MVDERSFRFGYIYGRRGGRPWKPGPRTRPKMPSAPWRAAAVSCAAIGALVAWLLFRDTNVVLLRVAVGAGVGFVVGMYLVETVWERRFRRRPPLPGPAPSPDR